MTTSLPRRDFLLTSAAAAVSAASAAHARPHRVSTSRAPAGPVVISSGRKPAVVTLAGEMIGQGVDPVDAVVEGVALVENDPNDMSVGYGGLPNERGVVELDSSVMHGPSHKAGAVASLRNIKNPARVALKVLRHTDHVLLVGQGALEFARAHGFKEEDLLTERAREAWLRWKSNLNPNDDWLDEDQTVAPAGGEAGARRRDPIPMTYGTIHCAAVNVNGDLSACTTTSGLSYKVPGRVGDSPILGAGMYVDNEVGSAGATGRGEAAMQSCASFQIVRNMEAGLEPTEACLETLRWIARRTRRPELLAAPGRPRFGLTLYALRKDGVTGCASMLSRAPYSVYAQGAVEVKRATALFE